MHLKVAPPMGYGDKLEKTALMKAQSTEKESLEGLH